MLTSGITGGGIAVGGKLIRNKLNKRRSANKQSQQQEYRQSSPEIEAKQGNVSQQANGFGGGANNTASTGTVWDSIKPTDANYKATQVPRSFELSTSNGDFWVHPNATEHIVEYSTRRVTHGQSVIEQQLLNSLRFVVNESTSNGIPYGSMIQSGNWELMFGPARKQGLKPVIFHALFRP